jgi:hypothetical protein
MKSWIFKDRSARKSKEAIKPGFLTKGDELLIKIM